MKSIHGLPLPTVLQEYILGWVGNEINQRAKERANRIIDRLATSKAVGDNRNLSDLIHATVYATPDWAWNPYSDGSLMWRFSYRPTPMQAEHMLMENDLDFSNCEDHPHYRYCNQHCRNGRNLERAGILVQGVSSWYRCWD